VVSKALQKYNIAVTLALEIRIYYQRISLVWRLEVSKYSTNCDLVGHQIPC